MLSDFRFRRGGVRTRILEATILAILAVGGCNAPKLITIGPPAKVAFTVQPGNVGAGSSITPPVVVSVEDSNGHVVTSATNQITIAIGTNPAGGTLSGTATVTAVAGVATFSNLSINNVGTGYTLAASATGLTGATSSTFSVVGPPTKLAFTAQPTNVAAGSSIAPAVTVSVEDANGNVVPTATNSITVAIGTNPSSGTLSGTATASAVNGVATFSNLNINKVGTGYTLTANTTGLTGGTSSAFNVTPGAAAKLIFTTQPTNTTAGVTISPAVVVTIEDSLGNVATSATNSITMGIGTGSGSLLGTTSVPAASGVATFSNLSINVAGTGYTLAASATGLTGATSSSFNVTVGAASKLVFTTEPSNVAAGLSVAPAVVVSVEDAVGNVVPTAANSIAVAIGTNPASGTLGGTTTVAATAGVATFSNLSINKIGTGYTLTASTGGLTGATSTAFNVTVGVAAQLVFTTQPTNTTAGVAINPAVKVTVEDSQGNVVTTATNSVTIAIGNNPASGTLSGTVTAAAVAGVATFSNLSINAAGTGYTLAATSGSLTGAASNAFNILVGSASKLVFTTQPTSATAGVTISPAVLVTIEDNQGNVVNATTSVSMALGTNPSATLNGTTTVAAVAGVATFSTLSINSAANGYTLVASVSGLSGATSSPFNITAAAPAKLAFTGEPINTVVSTDINPSVTVSIEDSFGNVVTTASTPSIALAIGANPGSGTLGGTVTASPTSGVATFSNLTINATGNGYTLTATASGLTGATSSVFNIIVSIGPPAKLAFTAEPVNTVAGVSITPAVQVSVEDSNGNTVPTATNTVTLSFASTPPAGAILSGTLSVAAVNGVAKFTNLSVNVAASGYSLQTASGSLTGATSTTFNITANSASKLAFTTQPTNVVSQTSISPAVAVSVQDAFGNLVTSATNQITVAIQNNPSSGLLGGTLVMNASGGVATFSNLTIDKAGSGYTLAAGSSPLAAATSSGFNVTAGSPAKLAFTVQPPTNVAANSSISPAVQVSIEDAQGNLTSAATQVTVAIGSNPASGTLSGTVAVNAVNGVAMFSTLSINNIGTGYTLTASDSSLTPATSNSFNVTAGCTTNCQLSGTVMPSTSGLPVSGVTISLSNGPNTVSPTTTNSSGVYSFTGLTQGTYNVTASLAGYTFSPNAPSVNVGPNSVQNFTETPALSSFSISGTLFYAGAKTGRTYIRAYIGGGNCNGGGCALAGTSLASAPSSGGTSYTVRGLQPGSYTVVAEVDTLNNGVPNASNPWGNSSTVTISSSNATGANVTLTDPTPPAPAAIGSLSVAPGNNSALIQYDQHNGGALTDNNGREIATSYEIDYDTSSSFSSSTSVTFAARGTHDNVYIAHNLTATTATTYYFRMFTFVGATKSAASSTVSAVIRPPGSGANTVSGSVTFPVTATGPLYVGVFNGSTIYGEMINPPYTSPVSYSYSGVPNGNYQAFAIIDQNNNGLIEPSDMSNVNNNQGGPPPLTVSGNTTNNIILTSAVSTAFVTTGHQQFNGANDTYNLQLGLSWGTKRPVAATIISGPNVGLPWDVPVDSNNSLYVNLNTVAPQVNDAYQYQVTFSDGSTQTLTATVSAVLNSFATSLIMVTSGGSASPTTPTLTWVTPASTPSPYTYFVGLFSTSGSSNVQWNDYGGNNSNGIAAGTTSVPFNQDGSATSNGSSISSLPPTTNYQWFVGVQDSNGNNCQESTTYNLP